MIDSQKVSPFIEISELSYTYPGTDVLAIRDLRLAVKQGEFLCILGPSGCGKSTLLSILSGLAQPSSGDVLVGGRPWINAKSAAHRIGMVFQDNRLLPWRTVRQNIEIALKAADIPKDSWDDLIETNLSMLEIAKWKDSWPLKLSGGQRQRAAIARALAVNPDFVLMDEPFSTLDEVTARTLRLALLNVWEATGKTIIFVTHSLREAIFLSDRMAIMSSGPGRVIDVLESELERPRNYEDPQISDIEARLMANLLDKWGVNEPAG